MSFDSLMADDPQVLGLTSKILPLAFPKGREKLCELCQRPATLQCVECGVTFYCNAEHQQADWVGIHKRICPLLVPIRTPTFYSLHSAGQIEIQLKKVELMEICRSVAKSKLSDGKHKEALPATWFCLRCAIDVHSPSSVQLIPVYLLLAEANMGVGNLTLVAELLSQLEWAMLRSEEYGHEVSHQLHRSWGRLHVATGNLEAALVHFANDIYYASEAYGVDSTVTSRGYFLIANVFAKQGQTPIAHSLYTEVGRTWHSYLTEIFWSQVQSVKNPFMLTERSFEKSQHAEVDETLKTILEFWQNDSRKNAGQTALVAHSLAMLGFLEGDNLKALGFGNMALQACQLIPNHDLTEPIKALLQLVKSPRTEPPPGSD